MRIPFYTLRLLDCSYCIPCDLLLQITCFLLTIKAFAQVTLIQRIIINFDQYHFTLRIYLLVLQVFILFFTNSLISKDTSLSSNISSVCVSSN